MVDIQHKNITGLDAAHPPFYPSESDPTTTLGAYRGWFKPSTGEVKIRNAANTAWLDVSITGSASDSAGLTAHIADTSDAHDASAISILDTGGDFTATDVEGALAELASAGGVTELDDLADVDTSTAPPADGQTLIWDDANSEWIPGSVAAGTVAAADVTYAGGVGLVATDAEAAIDELATEKANDADLTAHINDTSDAHDASAISYAGGTGMSATNAEAAIDELATEKANDSALTAHIGDTSDAHDASAISYAGGTGMSATDVEAAIDELATEKANDSALTAHLNDTSDAHDASAISILDTGGDFTATDVEGALAELFAGGGGGGVADLDDLTDVTITSPATDDVLLYNGSTWVNDSVPGGGGSGYRTLVTLGSDVATTAIDGADVTGLSASVIGGTTYRFYALIIYTTSNTANGSGWGVDVPASPTLFAWHASFPQTASAETVNYFSGAGIGNVATSSPATQMICEISGIVKPSSSGTLQIRFRSEGNTETITAKAGSTLEWW